MSCGPALRPTGQAALRSVGAGTDTTGVGTMTKKTGNWHARWSKRRSAIMSTYKHGDWFCKPANEEEAREIIERAVASGAVSYLQWAYSAPRYGVFNGVVETHGGGTEYTITQLRQKFPLPSELVEQERSGEDLPPVGSEVEYTAISEESSRCILSGTWYRGTVIAYHDGAVWTSDNGIRQLSNTVFRPIRSEPERWAEQALEYFCDDGVETMERIYYALKSGDLKAPE